jgi:hypothetical protein
MFEFRLFYMEPPILPAPKKTPQIHEFTTMGEQGSEQFDYAYGRAKEYIKTKKDGTQILMLAQMNR